MKNNFNLRINLAQVIGCVLIFASGRAFLSAVNAEKAVFALTQSPEEFMNRFYPGMNVSDIFTLQLLQVVVCWFVTLLICVGLSWLVRLRRKLHFLQIIFPAILYALLDWFKFSRPDFIYSILYTPGRVVSDDYFTISLINGILLLILGIATFLSVCSLKFSFLENSDSDSRTVDGDFSSKS